MKDSEKGFKILDALDRQEISTQRQLSEHTGISLGHINYVLKNFLKKGLVKIGNFRKNPRKISYVYLLTPKGIQAKSRLATKFVMSKLNEYRYIKDTIAKKLAIIGKHGPSRIIFVGPEIVQELLGSIINENQLNLTLVDKFTNPEDLKEYDPESYDIVILFDGKAGMVREIIKHTGISKDKLFPLW